MVYTTPDHYTDCHYTTNRSIINDPTINVTFEQILLMDDIAWVAWLERMRYAILTQWDTNNVPPRVGMTDAEIATSWDRLASSESDDVWVKTDDYHEALNVSPTSHSVIGQWFESMMKTRINYTAKDGGLSIYDMFSKEDIWKRYCKSYASRHFRRDSFYAYSRAIHTHESIPNWPGLQPKTAAEYLQMLVDAEGSTIEGLFDAAGVTRYGVWLAPAMPDDEYNGYSNNMKSREIWTLTHAEAVALRDSGCYPSHWFREVRNTLKKKTHYMVRLYDTSTRIFPVGFKSFRISICQYATNWPALAARALYERYTTGVENPVVWDPSSGWGGRLVGAITAKTNPLYIGCDPNTDHLWVDTDGVAHSKYTELAAYHASRQPFNETPPKVLFFPVGSETMKDEPEFQKYRGKIDVVFSSPPYFNREGYSNDHEQSAIKFSAFDDWCEGFLRVTIETAAEWLKPGGVLLWNIADIKQGGKFLPLEAKSIEYALGAGLAQQDTIRLLLANMPGANRIDPTGQGTAKNTSLVNGRVIKSENIFVFRKS